MVAWRKVGSFVTPASGTTVVDVTSKGEDPKAIHYFSTGNTSNQTIQANAQCWHGFAAESGPDSLHNHYGLSDATPNTQRWSTNTASVQIRNPSDDSLLVEGTVTFQATTFTVTYTTFTAGIIVNYECFGGSSVSAIVREMTAASSPHTGVGFTSDLLMFCTAGQQIPANSIHAYQSFGVAHDNGVSIDQWCLFSYMGDNDLDFIGSGLTSVDCCGQYDVDFASWQIQVTVIGADGFTWTGTNGDEMTVLCLNFGGAQVDVGTFAKSTAAAPVTQALPDVGFTPTGGYYLCSASDPSEAINVDQDCRTAHGGFDGTDARAATTTTDDTTSTDRHSRVDNAEVLVNAQNLNAAGVESSATPNAITDSTPDFEWDPNSAAADVIGYYALEDVEAAEPSTFLKQRERVQTYLRM